LTLLELHDTVVKHVEEQPPLCVYARDEEMLAYLRAVRAEYPTWRLVSVTGERPPGCPVDGEETEWRLEEGSWSVRRARWVTPVAAPGLALDEEAVYLITGGLGYLGRLTAKALMGHGARRVVLVSSRTAEVPADWDGPFVPSVERCDVGDFQALFAPSLRSRLFLGCLFLFALISKITVSSVVVVETSEKRCSIFSQEGN